MPKKKKHPRHMTTEEAMKHLFHPNVVKHVKRVAHEGRNPKAGSK